MDKVLERFFTKQTENKVKTNRLGASTHADCTVPVADTSGTLAKPESGSSTTINVNCSTASVNGVKEKASCSASLVHDSPASTSSNEVQPLPLLCPSAPSPVASSSDDVLAVDSTTTKEASEDTLPPPPDQDNEAQGQNSSMFTFYSCTPSDSRFLGLIDFICNRGMKHTCDQPIELCTRKEKGLFKTFLSLQFISQLCDAAISVFASEPNMLEVDVQEDESLVVVGDIHGQFNDFFTSVLVQQYSPELNPGREDRKFLFLGDFVDRGPHSLDVILLIFALKVEYPNLISVTRGNHEESKTSRVYGFLTEMQAKLGPEGSPSWSKINSVFPHIPLCATVKTPLLKIFATHGGLSPALLNDTSTIARVERQEYCLTLKGADEDIVNGLLWSDPTTDCGYYDRNPRGCGVLFGPTATATFCEKNGFDFICRAHQVVTDGFLWRHNNKVVTIFSAPNYCGINGNLGAVMILKGSSKSPTFIQYECFEDLLDDWQSGPSKNFPYASCFV